LPEIVDRVLAWRAKNHSAVVFVTHDAEERARWRPSRRFEILDKHIAERKGGGYWSLNVGIPARTMEFPEFRAPYDKPWVENPNGRFLLIHPHSVEDTEPFRRVLNFLRSTSSDVVQIAFPSGGEHTKDLNCYAALVAQMSEYANQSLSGIVICGGGVVLNTAGFAAGTLFRGKFPVVLIPTTITAIADVCDREQDQPQPHRRTRERAAVL